MVIEFLILEGKPPINIFQRLEKVYGDAAIGYSAVKKWVSRIKDEEEDTSLSELRDNQRSEGHRQRLILETVLAPRN